MNQPPYILRTLNRSLRFDFLSVGKAVVLKSIIYSQTSIPNLYSLALVDAYPDGSTDDVSVTDNGDMEKVLVTVFHSFAVFFDAHPGVAVTFEGSIASRTRLYRIALSYTLAGIQEVYGVWGITETGVESFEKDRPYVASSCPGKALMLL